MVDSSIAFQIGIFTVRWYAICICLGIIAALIVASYLAKKAGIDQDHILNLAILAVIFGILGARLYYVLFNWAYYSQNWGQIFKIWQGGLAIHGAIIAGILIAYVYCKKKKLSFWQLIDCLVPGLILAQGFGRWGNYFNQEAYGYPTDLPWAMYIDGAYRHPTFLYESVWDIAGFIVLIWLGSKFSKRREGDIFAIYLIFYSLGRVVVESFRTDSLMLGPLRQAQVISIAAIILGVVLLCWFHYHKQPLANLTQTSPVVKPKQNKKKKK